MRQMGDRGLIQVFTGNGKGKTTAAIGQAIRAIGSGFKVGLVYFHKNPSKWKFGELKVLEDLGVEVHGFAKKHPDFYGGSSCERVRKECLEGLEFIENAFKESSYDMLILDEINISLRDGFLKESEILDLLEKKPKKMTVILTGRGAGDKLIEKADLVTEAKKIKHPHDEGEKGFKGIDF